MTGKKPGKTGTLPNRLGNFPFCAEFRTSSFLINVLNITRYNSLVLWGCEAKEVYRIRVVITLIIPIYFLVHFLYPPDRQDGPLTWSAKRGVTTSSSYPDPFSTRSYSL